MSFVVTTMALIVAVIVARGMDVSVRTLSIEMLLFLSHSFSCLSLSCNHDQRLVNVVK